MAREEIKKYSAPLEGGLENDIIDPVNRMTLELYNKLPSKVELYTAYNEFENVGELNADGSFGVNSNYRHSNYLITDSGDAYGYSLSGYSGGMVAFYNYNGSTYSLVSIILHPGPGGNTVTGDASTPVGANRVVFASHVSVVDLLVSKSISIAGMALKIDELDVNSVDPNDNTDLRNMLPIEAGSILANYASKTVGGYISQKTMFCFSHISDTHNYFDSFDLFNTYLENHGVLDLGVITGDILENSGQNFTPYSDLINANSKPILVIAGNHDTDVAKTESDLYTKFIAPIATKIGITTGHTWYSYKDTTYDIKIIVMNEYSNTSLGVTRSFTQAQIDWFINELDEAISNNQSVICMMHISPSNTSSNTKAFYQQSIEGGSEVLNGISGNVIGALINAFKNGTTLAQTYTQGISNDIVINHTFSAVGKFIAHIGGHWHCDRIGYLVDYPDQLSLIANSGIPNGYTTSDLPRQVGEETETCFNVYAIDTTNNKVYVVRVGSNINTEFKARQREEYVY